MIVGNKDMGFNEWQKLSFSKKSEIWNHYWNPYEPEIGSITKREIIENFIIESKLDALQFGIASFGWGVYMLFVIVENSKTRVPREYSDLPVNKGVVKRWIDKNKVEVKFGYGGIAIYDINEKIIVK